ncbi:MAG: Uracil-DNA glycosylase, family 4, partial [uncultured Rubrobacteraceae bacterium]
GVRGGPEGGFGLHEVRPLPVQDAGGLRRGPAQRRPLRRRRGARLQRGRRGQTLRGRLRDAARPAARFRRGRAGEGVPDDAREVPPAGLPAQAAQAGRDQRLPPLPALPARRRGPAGSGGDGGPGEPGAHGQKGICRPHPGPGHPPGRPLRLPYALALAGPVHPGRPGPAHLGLLTPAGAPRGRAPLHLRDPERDPLRRAGAPPAGALV